MIKERINNRMNTKPWHTLTIDKAFHELKSQPIGLSSMEVAERMLKYRSNELQAAHHVSPWEILLEQFKNVLILILLAATGISLFLGHGIESVVIAIIVLFAVILGFVQEFRAERAIEALRQMAAPTATVLRDGIEIKIPAKELVPGDVIILHTGDRVPADARLLEAINLQVEEAALTGESVPVEKHVHALNDEDLPMVVDGPLSWPLGCKPNLVRSLSCSKPLKRAKLLFNRTSTKSERYWRALRLWWLR